MLKMRVSIPMGGNQHEIVRITKMANEAVRNEKNRIICFNERHKKKRD